MALLGAVSVHQKVGKLVYMISAIKDTITETEIMTVSHMAVRVPQTDFPNLQNILPMDMLLMHWKLENMHSLVRKMSKSCNFHLEK